jgi:hypothetical protein
MKVPTVGTSVFSPVSQAGGGTVTTNFPVDLALNTKPSSAFPRYSIDRLRGSSQTKAPYLTTESTNAEVAGSGYGFGFDNNTGYKDNGFYGAIETPIYWNFRRAPGFFDEVCWTGDGTTNQRISHNLGVAPELIITKGRSGVSNWYTYASSLTSPQYSYVQLSATYAAATNGDMLWGTSVPTTTDFGLNSSATGSGLSGVTMVAYLFATCAGVSKVGSYTGTGTTKQIDCGFTAGSRFVMIKRTDSTGDWYVWDSARGIIAGNDPYLRLNSTAAEVTSTDYVDTYSLGFEISSTAPAAINASGGTFIFLAIA